MRSEEYATMFRVEETHWWYRALHQLFFQMLEAKLPNWRQKRILDAGCGTGAILQRLGSPERNVGIDLAPEAVSFCHQRGLENVQQGNVAELPFSAESFDAVISSSVIYHDWVPDVDAALCEMHRVLRPNGLLLLNVPAFDFLHSAHDDAVMTARRFRKNEVRSLLQKDGFAIERLTYWTALLFPLAVIARTLHGSKAGRDFNINEQSFSNLLFGRVMAVELALLKKISFPFGVAVFAVARK